MQERVQKILAQAGIASRRKSEELIQQGRVKVNNTVIKLGDQADKEKDTILVDEKPIILEQKIYIMLNKPKGATSTREDPHAKTTILDLVKIKERIYPIGRLDKDAEGLIILTNDGELANKIMHPSYEAKKEYQIQTDKKITQEDILKLNKGIIIEDRKVEITNIKKTDDHTVKITIHEGRKHIVKKIFEQLGFKVLKLLRTKINKLALDVQSGQWRHLKKQDLSLLLEQPF